MRRLLAISALISLCISLPQAGAAPHENTRVNYGGKCATEDAIYVEGNQYWRLENTQWRGSEVWHFGGTAIRINDDQIKINQKIYTRIGSPRYKC